MTADEIRTALKDFKARGEIFEEAAGAELVVTFMAEIAAQLATIHEVLSKGIHVDATTREGSQTH